MDKEDILNEIFANDPLGILEVKPKASPAQSEDSRFLAKFQEINAFYEEHNREPEPNPGNVKEYQLYLRLKGLREAPEKVDALLEHDQYDLLLPPKEINSIEDIFSDSTFDLLSDDPEEEQLFELKHVPAEDERQSADFVATRKPCKNFQDYEPLFKEVQEELAQGKREMVPFKVSNIYPGSFYVLNGVLFYLESTSTITETQKFKSGKRDRKDGRTRCIFENGTESKMLYRSAVKALQKDGYLVTHNKEKINEEFYEKFSNINEDDQESGFIYVLSSLSEKTEIKSIPHLFKIGYSKTDVRKRIQNAKNEATYLMAPVKVEGIWKCFNMNPQKFESVLHTFFGSSCLNVEVVDAKGHAHAPREWFIVPYSVIEEVIPLIMTGKMGYGNENCIFRNGG